MLEAVQGKAFVVEDLTDSLANFKSALRANSIPGRVKLEVRHKPPN